MSRLRTNAAAAVAVSGAGLLAALALWSLPWKAGLGPAPTPFDRSAAPQLAPTYGLLSAAAAVIPEGASFVVRAEPRNAGVESDGHRLGLALLPGRRALPSAYLGVFTPEEIWRDADYVVVVGRRPAGTEGAPLLETPAGTVWRRPGRP